MNDIPAPRATPLPQPAPGTRLQAVVVGLLKWFAALVGLVIVPQILYAGVRLLEIERTEVFEVGLSQIEARAQAPTLEATLLLVHTHLDRLDCTPPQRGPVGDGMGWRSRCTGRRRLDAAPAPDVLAAADSRWAVAETELIPARAPALAQLIPPWWLLFACALPAFWLVRHGWRQDLGRAAAHPWASLGWLVLPAATSLVIGNAGRALGVAPERMMAELGHSFTTGTDWGMLAAVVVAAPVLEELLFRGLAWRWLRPSLGAVGMIAFSVVVFTGLHAGQYGAFGVAMIAVLAVVLALVRERTGSLALCIGGHVLVNGLAMAALLAR